MTRRLALSTMYAQHDRFVDGAVFARFAADAGYDGIEVSHSTPPEKLDQIAGAGALPIVSLHQPAPFVLHDDGRPNADLNLASPDDGERAAAVVYARRSFEEAHRLGARNVVVHLGHVVNEEGRAFPVQDELLRAWREGVSSAYLEERREELRRAREERAGPFLDAARRSLVELVSAAEPLGIAIGIENRVHYHEIPLVSEYQALLDGFTARQAGYWHDTGHAEVLARLGLVDRAAWFEGLGDRCIGAHVHDVDALADHRAPGRGDMNWGYVAEGLGHLGWLTLEINQYEPEEAVRGVRRFLASRGLT